MAASSFIAKQKENKKEITDCGLCSKTVEDPRMLGCFHTFCFKCLTGYVKEKFSPENINCPVCSSAFQIPSGGLANVPVNDFVNKLIRISKYPEKNKDLEVDSASSLCDQCQILDKNELAVGFCVYCSEHMCADCVKRHKKTRLSAAHTIFTMEEKPAVDELLKITTNNCQDHPNNPLEAYCSDCRATLCTTCMHTGDHKEHICLDLKKAAAELSRKTYSDAVQWSSFMQEADDLVKSAISALEYLGGQIETARSGIRSRYEEIKVLLEKHYKELNENLDSIESERKRELERMRDEGKREMLMLESLERHWNEVKARGSDCDVVQAAISLQNRSEEVAKQHEEKVKVGKEDRFIKRLHRIVYEAADTFTIGNKNNLLGAIVEEGSKKSNVILELDWKILLNNPTVQRFTTSGSTIYDLVIHNSEVYMPIYGRSCILVYSLQNLSTVSRQISVPGLTSAGGLVYNDSDSCLYTSNYSPGHIYKINSTDDSVTGWPTENGDAWGLSISRQNNLLVSYYSYGQIDEFNGSGQLIRSIKLADGMMGLNHAIELKTGEFIICQRTPLSCICLLDSSGKVIKSYGGSVGEQLNRPHHVELDLKGNILVSDCNSRKLRVLTSDLKYVADVNITDAEFNCPTSTCWDKENGRLLVTTVSGCFYLINPHTN